MSYGLRGYNGRLFGLGACSQATPGDCAGPYSSPQANFDYQQQLQQSGYVSEQPIYNPPAPYTPGGPGEPNCTINAGGLTWVDNACVAAQSARSIANQDAIAAAQLAYNLQGCLNSQTPADVCHARYPGVTPSGNVGGPVTPPSPPPSTPPIPTPPPAPPPTPPPTPTYTVGPKPGAGAGAPILTAGGGSAAPAGGAGSSAAAGFSLSDIPWWGWGLAAAGAFFAFGGKR